MEKEEKREGKKGGRRKKEGKKYETAPNSPPVCSDSCSDAALRTPFQLKLAPTRQETSPKKGEGYKYRKKTPNFT